MAVRTAGTFARAAARTWQASTTTPTPAVAIVGAGPAGLAVGACLRRRGIPVVQFEREALLASAWRRHYQRLHLHTHRSTSGLPHRPWPRSAPPYPSRDEVVAYLEEYARHFDLAVRMQTPVRFIHAEGDGWSVHTDRATYRVRHVVVATGLNAVPHVPVWPGRERFGGRVLHAAEYRSGAAFRGQRVLVIGFGNSGAEIALDLHEHGAHPRVAIRGEVNLVPRTVSGLPVERIACLLERLPPSVADRLALGLRARLFGDLARHGVRLARTSPSVDVRVFGRVPVVDVGTVRLIRRGDLPVRPAVARFHEAGVVFEDGRAEGFDAVVLATGYRPSAAALFGAAEQGLPPAGAGIHACGFAPSPGGMLRRIGREARAIAARIADG